MKKYKNLRMDYYDDFICIGNKCEDTCCKNWTITVDKKTYLSYKNLKASDFKRKITNSIGRNRKSVSDFDYSTIKLSDGVCPMLSKDGLCEVYINLGEEYMCHTCKVYPRSYNLVDDIVESSLSISCIEVAKNILLRKQPIEFNLDIKNLDIKNFNKKINTVKYKNFREKYFNELRMFSIGLIQNRKFSIEERLIILGLFIKNISELKEDLVLETIQKYNYNIEHDLFDKILDSIEFENTIEAQLQYLFSIYKIMTNKFIKDKKFIENFEVVIKYFKLKDENPIETKDIFYKTLNNQYVSFIKKYEYIYENYLVNYMFKTLFPISDMSLLDTYINLVIHFAIIKMNLIGLCGYYNEKMDDKKVLNFIQSFAKVMEHDGYLVNNLHKYLSENNINTLAHTIILIGKD